ncbi:MAG: putative rane protein [Herbinix sp.]|jgi:membrane protein implicated in regulation of membrane protease activity|nr:putative rane protein [Herbinix sp.]
MTNSILWLLILAILIFIEIITLGLTTIWFAGGALIAFIVSLFFDNLLLEVILFLVVSMVLLYFTRPLVLRYFNPRRTKTNYEGVIGKVAMVTTTINNIKAEGQVVVNGQEWSAKALNDDIIEKGTKIKIHGITGVKLIVSIYKEEE